MVALHVHLTFQKQTRKFELSFGEVNVDRFTGNHSDEATCVVFCSTLRLSSRVFKCDIRSQ